ncbi:uncharacterized BrkB/YihY/UPF0761 family membrane protein [Paenibacillus sp. SORGH_AS306]|uniref:hypothetical protein n=1 Tax=unclassified Paenibacillus TaxID=185978 RepID=UPI002785459D|nr:MULTISPECIES: hypothetical protein [unclassified Paenibacillus]MDQ1236735.1 uncharacterized BrkB/YihY/UPF0761 family membrane protein [Paenibacillus sp. SORGH_AS_0306]MDR6109091.1 uncharacterized BrkB/YihY/UPF0761 family membrane protein [Paenibacillus sp. SORGH_AS_0338]
MNYSRLIIGSVFFIAGTLLFGFVHVAVANMFTHTRGPIDMPEQFNDFLGILRLKIPYIISIIFMCIGLILLITTLIQNHSRKE